MWPISGASRTPRRWTLSGTLDYHDARSPAANCRRSPPCPTGARPSSSKHPAPILDQPGYALWDASLVWTSANDRYTIGLHAKNILDKQYITSGYQFLTVNPVTGAPIASATRTSPVFNQPGVVPSLGREGVVTAFYGNPRQISLSFGLNF